MRKTKHTYLTLTLILIIMMLTACSPAEKTDSAGAQAGAVSSGDESENKNPEKSETEASDTAQETAGSDTAQETAERAEADSSVKNADGEKSDVLQDGTYVPTMFNVQGGTGKVTITCTEVTVTGGEASALVEISSPHYEWVKVDGVQYEPENADEADRKHSVFRIPVVIDEEMAVSGLTTAMSEPHEIEYTLFISLTQEESARADSSADKDAPNGSGSGNSDGEDKAASKNSLSNQESAGQPPVIDGLTFVSSMEKAYAETFDIYSYKLDDGSSDNVYQLIDVHNSSQYLLMPENSESDNSAARKRLIKNLPDSVVLLQAPLDNLYVAATSSMALFDAAGAIGQVKLTGTKADGWYIEAPKKALADGSMIYAGKYSAPDYELLASSGCRLAVESMMILHSPEVKEKLEELGIPVFIDTSSNESHPMGRTEWVRLYGVLTGNEKEAEAFFEEQKKQFAQADSYTDTGLTVAFFSISSGGNVIVRAKDDYIPRMIELAGGKYIFENLLNDSGNSASVRLSMEDFYNTAKDADFLIYNATIESPVKNIDQLCGLSALLMDFKAVKEGNVWQVQRSLYQSPDIAARMITDLHGMLTGIDPAEMTFLEQLK